jgi:hypothetical protein
MAFSDSLEAWRLLTLTAYSFPSSRCFARQTRLKPPSPNRPTSLNNNLHGQPLHPSLNPMWTDGLVVVMDSEPVLVLTFVMQDHPLSTVSKMINMDQVALPPA